MNKLIQFLKPFHPCYKPTLKVILEQQIQETAFKLQEAKFSQEHWEFEIKKNEARLARLKEEMPL